jgi:hypothetical protein
VGRGPGIWHAFRLGYELGRSNATRVDGAQSAEHSEFIHSLHFDGALAQLPGYLEARPMRRFFYQGNLTRFSLDVARGADAEGMEAFAETMLIGWHRQTVHGSQLSALTVGVPIAYRYRREEVGAFRDRLGVLHLPGLGADVHRELGSFALRLGVRLHGDFVGVNAMNNGDWNAAHADEQGKTILRKEGYYYGWGGSALAHLELSRGPLALGGSLWLAHYVSQEGEDRIQEQVTLDVASDDDVRDLGAWLRVSRLPGDAYALLRYSRQDRDGRLGEFSATESLESVVMQVGIER